MLPFANNENGGCGMATTAQILASDRDYHLKLISQYEEELTKLPDGCLLAEKIRGRQRFYHRGADGKKAYLSKKKQHISSGIGQKTFY
jgi:hypothetical protein